MPRERGIQRLKLLGRLHQQRRSISAAAQGERDLAAQQGSASLLELIQRLSHRRVEQFGRHIQDAGLQARLRGRQSPPGPAGRVGGQLDRTLPEGRRGG